MHKKKLIQYHYFAFGLNIKSDFELPELLRSEDIKADINIIIGNVPSSICKPILVGGRFEASPGHFLFRLENVGSYYVSNGERIVVEPSTKATSKEIRLFLLGTCMGALLHQRGALPIHGSVVNIGNSSVVITGKSASGKSSLAAGFQQQGYPIIADDIAVISRYNGKFPVVFPGVPYLKLWKDVIDDLDIHGTIEKIRPGLEKYRVFNNHIEDLNPLSLNLIIQLTSSNKKGYRFEEIHGISKFFMIRENIYRMRFIDALGQSEVQFRNISNLAKSIRYYIVERPYNPLNIRGLMKFITQEIISAQ